MLVLEFLWKTNQKMPINTFDMRQQCFGLT